MNKLSKKLLVLSLCCASIFTINANAYAANSGADTSNSGSYVQTLPKEKLELINKFPNLKKSFDKDSNRKLVDTKETYYRVEPRDNTNTTNLSVSNNIKQSSKFKFVPLTKEQCLNEVLQSKVKNSLISGNLSASSVLVGEDPTRNSWIKLTLDVYKCGDGTYNAINFFEWLTNPYCALEDSVSVTYDSRFALSTRSAVGEYEFDIKNINTGAITTSNKPVTIKKGTGGVIGSFTLASNTNTLRSMNNRGYLSVYVLFGQPISGQTGAIFGDYAHKQVSLTTEVDIVERKLSAKPSYAFDQGETTQVNVKSN